MTTILLFWLVISELDRKPERELGELEEVRKGETCDVDAAVDPVREFRIVAVVARGGRGGGGVKVSAVQQ